MPRLAQPLTLLVVLLASIPARAEEPLHARIDRLILAGAKPADVSPRADDAEFLRRISLDLTGTIPNAAAGTRSRTCS